MAINDFFMNNITIIRRAVQASFALFTLYAGYQFFLFYQWSMGQGEYVARPPAVEGFLPISALLSLKRLFLTGEFDPIHPAGLVILMAALTIGLLARKGFCGWICPVGFASHLAQWLGARLKILLNIPTWSASILSSLKYLLLGFFLYVIVWNMDVAAITSFLQTPYNLAADAKMLQFFLAPTSLTLAILIFFGGHIVCYCQLLVSIPLSLRCAAGSSCLFSALCGSTAIPTAVLAVKNVIGNVLAESRSVKNRQFALRNALAVLNAWPFAPKRIA